MLRVPPIVVAPPEAVVPPVHAPATPDVPPAEAPPALVAPAALLVPLVLDVPPVLDLPPVLAVPPTLCVPPVACVPPLTCKLPPALGFDADWSPPLQLTSVNRVMVATRISWLNLLELWKRFIGGMTPEQFECRSRWLPVPMVEPRNSLVIGFCLCHVPILHSRPLAQRSWWTHEKATHSTPLASAMEAMTPVGWLSIRADKY